MAKKSLFVDRGKFESAIKVAEQSGPLANRSKLYAVVAEIYNKGKAADAPTLTPSVVYLRIGEYKIAVKTPLGKKGRGAMSVEQKQHQVALMQAGRSGAGRVSKAEKFAKDPVAQSAFEDLKKRTPARFQPLVLKVIQGSRTAALKLKCLDCANYQPIEIKLCPCTDCSLWNFRSYQKSKVVKDESGAEAVVDSTEENSDESEE